MEEEDSMEKSIYNKKKRTQDLVCYGLIYLSAALVVVLLAAIIGYVFVKGLPVINKEFITKVRSTLKGTDGVAGNILNTIYLVVLTLLLATPLGVGAAVYLNEYAKPGKLVRMIEFTTETLSGIPSIIFGLFGMEFFGRTLGLSYSILNGVLTMTLMILPLITRNTQEALKTVPDSYRHGAIGMGAGRWYMIRTILLPSALPGILTGIILSIGRIVGESAALLFTAGSGYFLPKTAAGYWEKLGQSGGTLSVELYLRMSKGEYTMAFGIAATLLLIVVVINLLTKLVAKKVRKNGGC